MSLELTFAERRLLGALIEKGLTTPEQYPLSLNSAVLAANQKSCRDPLSTLDESSVLQTLESLRQKGLATLVRSEGSRVDRWKHRVSEKFGLAGREAAVLAELLLRGPQTDGELRQRASRMAPLETLDDVARALEALRSLSEPLVERITPEGRRRGVKYAHTLYPPAERPHDDGPAGPEEVVFVPAAVPPPAATAPPREMPERVEGGALFDIQREIQSLKERVEELEATFVKFLR
jgi:uncharacterized protein YceH (UPF0502 family)